MARDASTISNPLDTPIASPTRFTDGAPHRSCSAAPATGSHAMESSGAVVRRTRRAIDAALRWAWHESGSAAQTEAAGHGAAGARTSRLDDIPTRTPRERVNLLRVQYRYEYRYETCNHPPSLTPLFAQPTRGPSFGRAPLGTCRPWGDTKSCSAKNLECYRYRIFRYPTSDGVTTCIFYLRTI